MDYKEKLRLRAEEILSKDNINLTESETDDLKKVFLELKTYQVELELQNEEFQKNQVELQNSRDRFQDLFTYAPVSFFEINLQGIILKCNQKANILLNKETNSLEGKALAYYIHPESNLLFSTFLKRLREGYDMQRCEIKLNLRNDSDITVIMEGRNFHDHSENQKFIISMIDVSEIKKYEKDLQKAREEAESANKIKSQFLANLSHELRTPLNGIFGYTQLLLAESNLTEIARNMIEIIYRSTEHLMGLINDILDASKIEAKKLVLENNELGLKVFLSDIKGIFHTIASNKSLDFYFEINSNIDGKKSNFPPNFILADEKRLKQIIYNLLSNACKFTNKGFVKIVFEFTEKILTVRVIDTGRGISDENLKEIFEPFHQVGPQRSITGTGLGLSISLKLIELMGGTLTVRSKLDEGSEFEFTIPIKLINKAHLELKSPNKGKIIGYRGERKRILVVDDVDLNRLLIKEILKPYGFEIREAKNGEDALISSIEFRPDIILLDYHMPDMTGLDVAKILRKSPDFQNTVIISVSASANETYIQNLADNRVNAFLIKPFKIPEFLNILKSNISLDWIEME
jgi:PAS domain S-box-containing protein